LLDLQQVYSANRTHLEVLTDEIGIMQHAIGSLPDPIHGSCTDDVARALQVDLLHANELGWAAVRVSADRSLAFLAAAFDTRTQTFRNFRSTHGAWLPGPASEDSQARAILALGEAIAGAPDPAIVSEARSLFESALPAATRLTALRARASVLLGCVAAMDGGPGSPTAATCRQLARSYRATFDLSRTEAWPWPEPVLTYENALPARALIVAGQALGNDAMTDTGLRVLDWLIVEQLSTTGYFTPIGNGWWPVGEVKSQFDQQPIEATSLLLAAESAFSATGDDRYRAAMGRAYGWFLGDNDLGVPVADPARGAAFDGLTPVGVNTNQGAESTLMWLTAAAHMRGVDSAARGILSPPRGSLVGAGG
jgi:hypothetical protein